MIGNLEIDATPVRKYPAGKTPPPPPPPPSRQFRAGLFGTSETGKSLQDRRDWKMFMKGYRFALGMPNIPQSGDYL